MRTDSTTTEPTTFVAKIKGMLSSLLNRTTPEEATKAPAKAAPANPELETIFIPSEMYADFVRRAVDSDRNNPDNHYTTKM